MTEITSKNL